jgi:hypothetical protein
MIKMMNFPRITLSALAILAGLTAAPSANALTINGTTGAKYLASGSAVNATSIGVLKISFENKTSGTNLSLCAGTAAEFSSGTCGTELASSGGPGFTFLAIQDASKLNGKLIYVIRNVGSIDSAFTIVE